MALRTIRINPATMKKADYDIEITRDVDDLEWIAPAGAANLIIDFYQPHKHLSPSAVGQRLKRSFSRAGHGKIQKIWYKIVIEYQSGDLVIDPMLKILP